MEVSGWIYALAIYPLIHIQQEAGWAPEPVWIVWEENNLLFLPETGTTPWLSSLQPNHYTVWFILALNSIL